MSVFCELLVSMFAALGIALVMLEFYRRGRAKRESYVCLCFREELLNGGTPDMLIICRTDTEQEEIIRRVCTDETRKVFIKRF